MQLIEGKSISDLLFRLYQPPLEGMDFFCHVLSLLDDYLPATLSGYSLTRLDSRVAEKKMLRNLRGGALPDLAELNRAMQNHPFIEQYYSNSCGSVLCTTDVMPEEDWAKTDLCREFYRPFGVVHDASVRFYHGSFCISFEWASPEPLCMQARQFLQLVAPHLDNAFRLYRIQQREIAEAMPGNMVRISKEGQSTTWPPEAIALFEKYYPESKDAKAGVLPKEIGQWVAQHIPDRFSSGWMPQVAKHFKRKGGEQLIHTLVRYSGGFVLFLEETKANRLYDGLLKLGLTNREAEVLIWVAQGKQNSDVAMILGISAATVRKHIEHVLQKLACETRGAATQIAMQVVSDQSLSKMHMKCLTCTEPICQSCTNL